MRIVIACAIFLASTSIAAPRDDYDNRWGIRLSVDGGVYGSYIDRGASSSSSGFAVLEQYVNRVGAGWLLPIQLEGTYSVTNAFEILAGLRYSFSSALFG